MKKLLAALLLAAPVYAQSPCDGKIQDWLPHPKGAAGQIAEPPAGGSYVDPVFGTKITRISAPNPAEGTNAVISTLYNGTPGWNADGSQIIAWHRAGARTYEFYQGDTPYGHLGTLVFGGAATLNTAPADIEHLVWDATDPNVIYYPAADSLSSRQHPMLMKVTLHWPTAPTITLVRDFMTECQAHGVTGLGKLDFGHSEDMSHDGDRKIGVRCGTSNTPMWSFLYSITRNVIIGDGYIGSAAVGGSNTYDYPPWAFPSGNGSFRQAPGWIYDAGFNHVGTPNIHKTLEHLVVGNSNLTGDFIASAQFDQLPFSGSLLIWKASDPDPAQPLVLVGQPTTYPASGTHPMLPAKDGSGWTGFGGVGTGTGNSGPLDNELVLANVDTKQVCRIAHARTCDGNCGANNWNYWAETHPQMSNDGYRVLFNSDWEGSNTVSLFVADTRPSALAILTPSLPNAVKGEPYHVPVSVSGGQPPYTCSFTSTPPAGIHPNGCAVDGPSTGIETTTFNFHVVDSLGAVANHAYALTSQERPVITTASPLPDQIVGMPITLPPLTATGGVPPYTWTLASGALCAGTVLNPDGSWTVGPPITLQTCLFTPKATDSHAQPIGGVKALSLTIKMPPAGGCPCAPSGLKVKVEVVP